MMRILFYIHLLFLALTAALGVSSREDLRISDVIAESVLNVGHSVGKELSSLHPHAEESEVFSPLSLITALSLLTLGAKGKSYQELIQVLGVNTNSELIQNPNKFHEQFGLLLNELQHKNGNSGRPNANWRSTNLRRIPIRSSRLRAPVEQIIKVANGLFVLNGYSLNLDYGQVLKSIYETEFTQLDFQSRNTEARDTINAWASKATFGRIPKIIYENINQTTKVILASTLYFKAFWETQFSVELTTLDNFFPDGEHNPPMKVQTMTTEGTYPFYDAKEYDCRIIGLPYRDNETTMYVIQPNKSSRQKLRDLQHVLDAPKINKMIDNMERKMTALIFPKMHFKRSTNLKKILKAMNVNDIFVKGVSDLSLIGQRPENGFAVANVAEHRPFNTAGAPASFPSIFRKRVGYESLQSASSFQQDIASLALSNLESSRHKVDSFKSDLYVDEIFHNVDFSVDEQGTEAAAVTHISFIKTGPEVYFRGNTPFLILIRHDPTKLPLFYGIINKPELLVN